VTGVTGAAGPTSSSVRPGRRSKVNPSKGNPSSRRGLPSARREKVKTSSAAAAAAVGEDATGPASAATSSRAGLRARPTRVHRPSS
jgi:hypothetical protein